MELTTSGTALLALVLVAAVAALVAAVLAARSARRSFELGGARLAAEQAETLRWVATQLAGTMDRFHTQLADFGQRVAEAQGSSGEAVQRSLEGLGESVGRQLSVSQQTLGEGLAHATETFGQLQNRLGEVSEMAARMAKLAASVDELGSILKVPKLRGLMGEQTLEAMLRQVLPRQLWASQHRFPDGRTVDAVVRVGDRLLPVDAKFPLEAYRRLIEASDDGERLGRRRELLKAVRARVVEIAERYIRPGEGTTDFALMFIPAEGVYAEVVGGGDGLEGLLDEALAQRVVPVSPATIFAFLSVVASGMRGLAVEERAREMLDLVAAAEQEITRLREELSILGRHLHNAVQRHAEVELRLVRVAERLAEVGRRTGGDAPSA